MAEPAPAAVAPAAVARGAAAALALLVLGLSLPLLALGAPAPAEGHPARATELLVPGLFAPLDGVTPDTAAAARSWLDGAQGPWPRGARLHVGLTPLVLALLGLLGGARHPGPALLLAGALGLVLAPVAPVWVGARLAPVLLVAGLALLAGRGLGRALTGAPPAQELVVASTAVVLCGTLAVLALNLGAADDASVLEGLGLERQPPALAAAAATGLRQALDPAALASFAAMSALLLLLRWRGAATALLVLVVAATELALAHGWLGGA